MVNKTVAVSIMLFAFILTPRLVKAEISPVAPGQTISAAQINAIIAELNFLKSQRHIVKTYRNGSDWYEVYSDGWVRQSKYYMVPSGGINLSWLIPFVDTTYAVTISQNYTSTQGNVPGVVFNKGTHGFHGTASGSGGYYSVVAEGFGNSSSVRALGANPSY